MIFTFNPFKQSFTLPLRLPLKTMQRYECVRTQPNILVLFTLNIVTS